MPERHINSLLTELESRSRRVANERSVSFKIDHEDLVRLKALAEVYGLTVDEVTACLLHQVLAEVEEKMPYRAGTRVIRVEDDEPVYEDIGPTPRYLEAKRRFEQECA